MNRTNGIRVVRFFYFIFFLLEKYFFVAILKLVVFLIMDRYKEVHDA